MDGEGDWWGDETESRTTVDGNRSGVMGKTDGNYGQIQRKYGFRIKSGSQRNGRRIS